eukprot:TRINITY_DN1961_c0_g1_i1.p1 TRINITY_DN1961_c0_g1~~TRINITY_DN1961_c0_g1_i1.p1  ORF type:complete len:189 (-),score=48.00 TRINITY_DN1961_c0_g1_i1:82-648(-)
MNRASPSSVTRLDAKKLTNTFLKEDTSKTTVFSLNYSRDKKAKIKQRRTLLSAKEKRKHNIHHIPAESRVYDKYLPLNALWEKYVEDILQKHNESQIPSTLMKADFHGAAIKVIKSTCPSLIGKFGIVIMETENTFKIICRDNTMKSISKQGTLFAIKVLDKEAVLNGDNFCLRPAERAAKKFKTTKS